MRPHDLVIHRDDAIGGEPGAVERVTHLGFEVRVDVALAQGGSTWVQLSRGAAAELALRAGDRVWVNRTGVSVNGRSPSPAMS